jgi:enterochelin esterase-like enzyme
MFEHVPADIYANDQYFRSVSPYWLAQTMQSPDRQVIWIDIGDQDHWNWNARALRATLEARGISHQFTMFAGQHEGEYWVEHVPDYLRFYASVLPRAR